MRNDRKTKAQLIREVKSLREKLKRQLRATDRLAQANSALEESEERFRLIFENSADAILFAEPDGKLLSANPAACSMFGRTEDGIRRVGRSKLVDLNDPRQKGNVNERRKNGAVKVEINHIRKDGKVFPTEVSSVIFKDSYGKKRSIVLIRDITERKRSEEQFVKLNECLLNFGTNPVDNINRLTALAGELLEADSALYNRIDRGMLCSWGMWQLPPGYNPKDTPEGHICFDTICRGNEQPFIVRHLQETSYAQSDPNVTAYKLETYIGQAVKFDNKFVGSLCVVYQRDFVPSKAQERILGIIASAISVEEKRRHSEEALRMSKERYRLLVQNLPDLSVFLFDHDLHITLAEGALAAEFNLSRKESAGKSLWDMVPHERDEKWQKVYQTALGGSPVRNLVSEYASHTYEIEVLPVKSVNGAITGGMVVTRDITERKQAQDQLELMRRTIVVHPDGAYWVDTDNRIVYVNDAGCKVLGYEREELIGRPLSTVNSRATVQAMESVWNRLRSHGSYSTESSHRRKDGTEFPVEIVSALVKSRDVEFICGFVRDITERKTAEEALKRSEARWRSLVDNSPDFIALHDREGRFLFLNRYAEGFSEKDVIGKPSSDFVLPEHRSVYRTAVADCVDSMTKQVAEYMAPGDRGELRLYESTFVPIVGKDNEIRVLVVAKDITERKHTEETLRQSLDWQQAVFEGSRDAIFVSDPESRFVAVNSAASALTGFSREQLLRMTIPDLHDQADLVAYTASRQRIFDGEEMLTEAKVLRLDGVKVDTEFNNKRVSIAGKLFMHTSARDITKRKLAEEALMESEGRFRKVFEEGSIGMVMTSRELQFFTANPAFCQMLGYTKGEMNARTFLDVTHPEHRASDKKNVEDLWEGRIPRYRTEKRYVTKNGDIRWGSLSASLVRGLDGKPQYALGMIEDITDRKRAEAKLVDERALLSTILETIPDEICLKDTDSRYVLANKASVDALGATSLDEMIGKTDLDFVRRDLALRLLAEEKEVIESGTPMISNENSRLDPTTGELVKCDLYTKVPLKDRGGKVIGLLVVNRDITQRKNAEESVKRSRLRLRRLSAHMESVREEERKHISQEFHDQLGQTLTALKMDLSLMERSIIDETKQIARKSLVADIRSSQELVDRGIHTVRAIMSELRPELLDQLGLVAALEWEVGKFQQRSGIASALTAELGDVQLDASRSIALFRIVQEALTNVARHALATSVDVDMRIHEGDLVLEIKDNGIGISFESERKEQSFGLIGMHERAIFLGGTLEISGSAGKGTTISARIPVQRTTTDTGVSI